jgi:hypothetical protein
LHRVRYILGDNDSTPLDQIVEVDETYVGGKFKNITRERLNRHREKGIDNKVAVMGLLQRDGKAKLTVISAKRTFKDEATI